MPRIFGSLLRSEGQSGAGGTSGRASRTPFGASGTDGGGGLSARRGSMFKGTLRESDSTEGLRPEEPFTPRSRMENDIEFGKLDVAASPPPTATHKYSVSVVAGWQSQSVGELNRTGDKLGIKTTTVVTQQVVSFAALDEMERGQGAGEEGGIYGSQNAPSRDRHQ